jgi:hypothetical protein
MGGLYKSLKPLANAYAQITGYRQHGLRYDDLIIEEREDVQKVGDSNRYSRLDSIHYCCLYPEGVRLTSRL